MNLNFWANKKFIEIIIAYFFGCNINKPSKNSSWYISSLHVINKIYLCCYLFLSSSSLKNVQYHSNHGKFSFSVKGKLPLNVKHVIMTHICLCAAVSSKLQFLCMFMQVACSFDVIHLQKVLG